MDLPIKNRTVAGQALAQELKAYQGRDDVLVLALPRGGVPVAAEIAKTLSAGLDLILVRKLGLPGHEEVAMGAIASGGIQVLNEDVIRWHGITQADIDHTARKEGTELERRNQAYRGDRPAPEIDSRCIILVDDGLATGATMEAAIEAVRRQRPRELVMAATVAPPETLARLGAQVDDVVCLGTPEPFLGVGRWYRDFGQTSDEEVRKLLAEAWLER